MENREIYLTGIRPTSDTIHIWNYFWAILPMYEYAKSHNNLNNTYIFIADLHWHIGNSYKNLKSNIVKQYSIYKSIGFQNIYLQSDILEITQFSKYLEWYINLWKLNRVHTIKEKLKTEEYWSIKWDYLNYPILMSADILWIKANKVFLGRDQKQHLEIVKDIYKKIRSKIKSIQEPEWIFFWKEGKDQIIWLDWRKMSKSYNNYIDPFSSDKVLLKQVNKIQTENIPLWESKDFQKCNIIKILKLFLQEEDLILKDLKKRYRGWTVWYWETKKILFNVIREYFKNIKSRKEEIELLSEKDIREELFENSNKIRKNYKLILDEYKSNIL